MENLLTCAQWIIDNQNRVECLTPQVVTEQQLIDLVLNADGIAVTPEMLLSAYGFGFAAVVVPWSVAYAVGVARRAINLI